MNKHGRTIKDAVTFLRCYRIVSLATMASVWLTFAGPAQAELPIGYDVERVETPNPQAGGSFGSQTINVGDVDADGVDDLATAQSGTGPNGDGQVMVVGGDGSIIDTVNAIEPGAAGAKASFGVFVSRMSDIGSCAGGTSGQACALALIGAGDGVDEILVGATGVDGTVTDEGAVYILDGATRAVLKELNIPPGQAQTGANFGRTAINPMGQAPCAGNASIGACGSEPPAVVVGDLDGGGAPDLVVGAPGYDETNATNTTCPAGAACADSGRAYFFYGENIAGTSAGAADNGADRTILNPQAQADVLPGAGSETQYNQEIFSQAIYPVGDVGGNCTTAAPGASTPYLCPAAGSTVTQDGRPDVVISAFRVDDFGMGDVGVNPLVDGRTGAILYQYRHPEPQPVSIFGFTLHNEPAAGNLGSTILPDIYIPAMRQNTGGFTAGGRGYIMNGNFKTGPNTINFAQLNDPTPASNSDFGVSSAGVGNLDPATVENELLVGAFGPHNPGTNQDVINDISIFAPAKEIALQTVADPDQQPGSAFGAGVAPLGDVNGDGFMDLAAGANLWNSASLPDQGRIYIFTSDDVALRSLTLQASRAAVRKGRNVTLSGQLDATGNETTCEPGQTVTIERKPQGGPFEDFRTATTAADGSYASTFVVRRTFRYRATVDASASCSAAESAEVRVRATEPKS